VLFLPGQAGSYRQVRSFGTASAKLERQQPESGDSANALQSQSIDWFTVDFGDEWSGLSGVILQRQAAFAARCVERILALYAHLPREQRPRAVALVGHSMGGVVARAVAALPLVLERRAVGTVLALHSPLAPAALPHESVVQFYASIDASWCSGANARALADVALLSLGGGLRDTLVRSDLSAVPQRPCAAHNVSYATVLPSIEGIQRSADHQCGVWCLEVAERVALAFRQLAPWLDTPDESAKRLAVLRQHLGAPFRTLLRSGAAPAATSTASSSSGAVSAPATLSTGDAVTVKAGGANSSHWALVTTSPVARFVGRALPLPLTARDGVVVAAAPRLSLLPSSGEVLVRGATAGTTLVLEAQLAAAAATAAPFSLWHALSFAVTAHVSRFDVDGVPRGVALVARAESRRGCASRFVPRAIWCNERCDSVAVPLVEDYFVGLDESGASAVRFFGATERLGVLVVADAACVERVTVHVDWMATVGHLLRIHWQSLYSLAVVAALANASLALLLGGERRRLLVGGALLGATALLHASLEQLGVAAVAIGAEAVAYQLVGGVVQPPLRVVGWLLHLVARRDWVLLVAVALVGYVDGAAALVLGLATLVRVRREAAASREFVTRLLVLGVLVLPILATSTVVRIHAFTEHVAQTASGATYRGVTSMLLPQFVVWPCLVDLESPQQPQPLAARALLCAAGVVLAALVLVRQAALPLAELLDSIVEWAVVGSAVHGVGLLLAQREKAKSQ
jgi:hypothetical protein